MRRTALIAAAIGGLFASASFGAFTFSIGSPNRTLIPGSIVVQLYALNNGGGTGTQIKAFAPVLTGIGGGFLVSADDGGTPGDASDDAIDVVNAAGPSPTLTTAGNGKTYIRQGTAAQTFQVAVTPGLADLYNTSAGIQSFSVTETTTGTVQASSTVNGGLGFRTAVLVLSGTATAFTLAGQVGGDTGPAQTLTPQTFSLVTVTDSVAFNPTAVTVDVRPPGLEGFAPVTVTGTGTITFSALPAQIADNIVFGGTGAARTLTGAGFTFADLGTYLITATVGTATSIFTLNVIPEPTTIAALGMAGLGLIRRRK